MNSTSSFESKMLTLLKDSKIVKNLMMSDILDDFDSEILLKLLKHPLKIEANESGIIAKVEGGDDIICPNFSINISENGKWLSDLLPPCPFDIEQGGNLRKAEEAESAYFCAIVCLVLKDEIFLNEIHDTIKNYNYSEMDSYADHLNFKSLLNSWLDLQSVLINITVSAAKYRISDLKKDTEMFLRDGIPQEEVLELRELATSIKNLNRIYSTDVLSPDKVTKLSKIEILKHLEDKSRKINQLINESKVSILYKLEHLSTEYINPITKKKLINLAKAGVEEFYKDLPDDKSLIVDKRVLYDRWKRRFLKLEKLSVRKTMIDKYLQSPSEFIFPVKM
jgi:hypothetical protein